MTTEVKETTTIYTQFTDGRITAVFWSPQDPGVWPGVEEMQDDDPRYLEYLQGPKPSPEEALVERQEKKSALLAAASQEMTPVLLDLQLDPIPANVARAEAWQAYYRDLKAVDISVAEPEWPVVPE